MAPPWVGCPGSFRTATVRERRATAGRAFQARLLGHSDRERRSFVDDGGSAPKPPPDREGRRQWRRLGWAVRLWFWGLAVGGAIAGVQIRSMLRACIAPG